MKDLRSEIEEIIDAQFLNYGEIGIDWGKKKTVDAILTAIRSYIPKKKNKTGSSKFDTLVPYVVGWNEAIQEIEKNLE